MKNRLLVMFLVVMGAVVGPDAVAHPGAGVVSTGVNPVRSASGRFALSSTGSAADVIAAPADQDLILTDVVMGIAMKDNDARYSGFIELKGSDGKTYGVYAMTSSRLWDGMSSSSEQFSGPTGTRVPAGVSITLDWDFTYNNLSGTHYEFTYALSGYLAQP